MRLDLNIFQLLSRPHWAFVLWKFNSLVTMRNSFLLFLHLHFLCLLFQDHFQFNIGSVGLVLFFHILGLYVFFFCIIENFLFFDFVFQTSPSNFYFGNSTLFFNTFLLLSYLKKLHVILFSCCMKVKCHLISFIIQSIHFLINLFFFYL